MTRLHVRYEQKSFPQDLQFQLTPNRKNFQLRYITHHPAQGDLSCSNAQQYLKNLRKRRSAEVANLGKLTGWEAGTKENFAYIHAYDHLIRENGYFGPLPKSDEGNGILGFLFHPFMGGTAMALLVFSLLMYLIIRRRKLFPALTS